jgi:hypothetical protein
MKDFLKGALTLAEYFGHTSYVLSSLVWFGFMNRAKREIQMSVILDSKGVVLTRDGTALTDIIVIVEGNIKLP